MQTFAKRKMSLAVGAALLAIAGAAQASPPALRAANPILLSQIVPTTDANIRALLSATGLVNAPIALDIALTQAPVTLAAVATTIGNTTVTATSTANLVPGMVITGNPNIPALATVVSITDATTFVISAAATGTAGGLSATATPPAGPLAPGAVGSVASAATLVMNDPTPANNHVIVWAGATNANVVPSTGAAAVIGTTAAGVAHLTVGLPAPGPTAAYRVNGATGALEFTASTTAPVWNPVKVDIQQVIGNGIYTEVTGAPGFQVGDQLLTPSAGTASGNSLAPTPIISTIATPGEPLVGGFKIDTAASVTIANSNLAVKTRASNTAFPAAALPSAPTCVAATATVNGSCSVTFVGLGSLASAADFTAPVGVDAADVVFYNSTNFNTGVNNATVPWTVDGVNASKASYTNVFNVSDGTPAKLANFGGAAPGDAAAFPATNVVSDGAPPVIVTTAAGMPTPSRPAGTNLQLTFSEPMDLIGPSMLPALSDDLREVMENVFIGSNSVAALALNDSLILSLEGITTSAGQSKLTISGLDGGELTPTSTVTVTQGITFKEANDTGASAKVPAIDNTAGTEPSATPFGGLLQLAGGIQSASGAVEAASVTAKAVTPAEVTINFADSQCYAQTTAADPSKVGQIICTFPASEAISLANGLTTAALVNQIRVTVLSNQTSEPDQRYQFFPTAAQMTVSGTELKIILPTDLIYANVQTPTGMIVDYLERVPAGTEGALVKATASTVPVPLLKSTDRVAAGYENVKMPLSALYGANEGLVTQSIIGSFTTLTNGDRVTAYLAHWVDTPAAGPFYTAPITGTVSSPAATTLWFDIYSDTYYEVTYYVNAQNQAITPAQPAVPGVSPAVPAVAAKAAPIYFVVKDGLAEAFFNSSNSIIALSQATARSKAIIDAINAAAELAGQYGATATGADGSVITNGSSMTTSSAAALAAGSATAAAEVISHYFDGNKAVLPQAVIVAAANAAAAANATPASVVKAVLGTINDYKVRTASLDPVSGAITGAVTAKLVIKNATTGTAPRGLVIDSANNADGIVGQVNGLPNSFNLLVGVDPAKADLNALKSPAKFVILVHESAQTGDYTMLTSADAGAANFLPFSANLLTGSGARTTLAPIVLANLKAIDEVPQAWTLVPLGNPAKKAVPAGYTASFDQMFVGLNGGVPQSMWTNDSQGTDMALAMVGSKATAASEQGYNKSTLSTITSSSYIAGASALAWKNDVNGHRTTFVMQGTPVAAKVPAGWSLVTTPTSGTFGTAVEGVINVGSQTKAPFTWIKGDAGAPPVAGGDAVFVYSKAGGAL